MITIMMIIGPLIVGAGAAEGAETSNTEVGATAGVAKVVRLIEAQIHDEGVDAVVAAGGQVFGMITTTTTGTEVVAVQEALHHCQDGGVAIHLITAPKEDGSTVGIVSGAMMHHIARSDLHNETRLPTSLAEKLDPHPCLT